jgi:hypothetical protein
MEHARRWTPYCSPPATARTWTTSARSGPWTATACRGTPAGISATHPGLIYLGLEFQRSFSSNTLRGVYRDAEHVITPLAAHVRNAPALIGL